MSELVVSKTKLFIGGVAWAMRGNDLKEETKRSRGFGFVEFANEADAKAAQQAMDGAEVFGRTIKVDFAKEDPEKMVKSEDTKEDETVIDENVF